VPAEIDLDLDDPAVTYRHDLGVAEAAAVLPLTFVGDEDAIAVGHEVDEIKRSDASAVRPAALEIGVAVDAVVERAGEVEVVGDQRLDRRPILPRKGHVAGPRDVDVFPRHGLPPIGSGEAIASPNRANESVAIADTARPRSAAAVDQN